MPGTHRAAAGSGWPPSGTLQGRGGAGGGAQCSLTVSAVLVCVLLTVAVGGLAVGRTGGEDEGECEVLEV